MSARAEALQAAVAGEAGTPPIGQAAGMGATTDYLSQIGIRKSRSTSTPSPPTRSSAWRTCPGCTSSGRSRSGAAGIVSFVLEGIHPHDVAQILDWEGVAIRAGHHHCQPLMARLGVAATNRASFYLYTIPEEIDRLVAGLHKVKKTLGNGASSTRGRREGGARR